MTSRTTSRRLERTGYRYAAAVVLACIALSITRLLVPALGGDASFLVLSVGVTIAALLGGVGPGLLATAASAAGYAYFFFEPLHSVSVASRFESFLLFVSACSVVSVMCGWQHSGSRWLEREREHAQVAEADAKRAAERLALSQSITSDLAAARTQADVASVLVERGLKAFGAKALSVSVPISDEDLDVIQRVGYPTDAATIWPAFASTQPPLVPRRFALGRPSGSNRRKRSLGAIRTWRKGSAATAHGLRSR